MVSKESGAVIVVVVVVIVPNITSMSLVYSIALGKQWHKNIKPILKAEGYIQVKRLFAVSRLRTSL